MLYSVEIGRNIVILRKKLGITQEQLALSADVSVSRLRDIEHGRVNFSIDYLESISSALGVELLVLLLLSRTEADILDLLRRARQILERPDEREAV